MHSVVILVGDELLAGDVADENGHWLSGLLQTTPYPCRRLEIVADDPHEIKEAVRRAIADKRATRIVLAGGVGPTHDDRTLEATGLALDRPLRLNDDAFAHIERVVREKTNSRAVSQANRRMAVVPEGAGIVKNPDGMALGLVYALDNERYLFVLPGVPHEFRGILQGTLLDQYFAGEQAVHTASVEFSGVSEASIAPLLEKLENDVQGIKVGSYPQRDRRLIIRIRGDTADAVNLAKAELLAHRSADS